MVKEGFYAVILICILAVIAGLVGFVSPQLTKVADAVTDVQYASERAQIKMEAERAISLAQAEEIKARTEISKTQSQIALLSAQQGLEKARSDGARELARIDADARNASQFIQGMMTLGIMLLIIVIFYVVRLFAGDVMNYRNEQTRIVAQKEFALAAIDHMRLNGGTIKTPNEHEFTIHPHQPALPAQIPQIAAPEPAKEPVPIIQSSVPANQSNSVA